MLLSHAHLRTRVHFTCLPVLNRLAYYTFFSFANLLTGRPNELQWCIGINTCYRCCVLTPYHATFGKFVMLRLALNTGIPQYVDQCLQCFDAVGWAAGRASGL